MTRFALIGLLGLGVATASRAQEDGVYADFATSLGDFTVQLDVELAPRAVANFVGLATGKAGWLDLQSNVWHRPFYDGSLFHRVVKDGGNGIAIQGGGRMSVSGGVTNLLGPGYTMLENVTNGLAHSNGVISMANSGPNTDSSQFFITTTNVPYWDGGYSVFGRVVSGMAVVTSIAAVAVGPDSRPVDDIVLSNVVIRRVGAAAESFDITTQGVPSPESTPMRVYRLGSDLTVEIELEPQSKPLMYSESPDMQQWEHERLLPPSVDFYAGAYQIITGNIALASLGDKYFFHSSRIRYPVPLTAPATQRARTFTFRWDVPDLTYQVTFATNWWNPGTGWVQEGTNAPFPRVLYGDTWTREAYMGRLGFIDDLGREYQYNLGFNPGEATNRFTGRWWDTANPAQRYPISGVFTMP